MKTGLFVDLKTVNYVHIFLVVHRHLTVVSFYLYKHSVFINYDELTINFIFHF